MACRSGRHVLFWNTMAKCLGLLNDMHSTSLYMQAAATVHTVKSKALAHHCSCTLGRKCSGFLSKLNPAFLLASICRSCEPHCNNRTMLPEMICQGLHSIQ